MISMDKQYRTRDGREVRIYAVDGGGLWPVHGATLVGNTGWDTSNWCIDGRALSAGIEHERDLIEVKPKITRTFWISHYDSGSHAVWRETREELIRDLSGVGRIAITGPHTVEFCEGDGL